MKAIILAAGYATRLYPLTKDFPKPLLPVGKSVIIDYITEKIQAVDEVDEIFVVTNAHFYKHFLHWSSSTMCHKKITIVNDYTTSNENRLGAIRDLYYVIESQGIEDDVMVLAGDNLFEFQLTDMASFFFEKGQNVITTHELEYIEALKRTGVIQMDQDCRVTEFVEKPLYPASNLAVPPFYIFNKETVIKWIKKYIADVRNETKGFSPKLDAPGNLIPYLIENSCVYAYQFHGNRYDIGNLESYERVKEMFCES